MTISTRAANFLGFAACALLLGYAYYLQYHEGLEPCPLCIFQRVALFGVAVLFLIAALHNAGRIGARIYGGLLGVAAAAGAGLSIRHIYIQSQPEGSVPACGATLDYLMEVFPLMHVIKKVLTGSGECAKVDWTLWGLSMPWWVLGAFVVLGAWAVIVNWRRGRVA